MFTDLKRLLTLFSLALLAACGGGGGSSATPENTPGFIISGVVNGLGAGKQLILVNNSGSATSVLADGAFSFGATVPLSGAYEVTVRTQPAGQTCSVSNGSGAGVVANVRNVVVTCSSTTYQVGGVISGLSPGKQVTLSNNAQNPMTVSADGAFSFNTPVPYNGSYSVTITQQPTGQLCTTSNGSGAGVTADVSNIVVVCSANSYQVSGAVVGLGAGKQVTLFNNGGNPTTAVSDGAFSFSAPVAQNGGYAVTVGTQPIGQTCTVNNGSGAGVAASVSNVVVICSANTYQIAGAIVGLAAGKQVTLFNNTGNPTTLSAEGAFSFSTQVAFNGSYSVTVGTQPVGQTCSVNSGSGAGVVADVSNIVVICSTNAFQIAGTAIGLGTGKQVTLFNNAGNPTTLSANGAFSFSAPVAQDGSYSVIVASQPSGQTCTVSNGSGAGVVANVTNVVLVCSTNTYQIAGAIVGLAAGKQVTLFNNSGNPTTVSAEGAFIFNTPVAFNGSYSVTVGSQPSGQTCTVSNGSGAGVVANVNNVMVTCSTNTYQITGTVVGLGVGKQVTLYNNGGNPTTVATNGTFNFSTPVAFNGSYSVTVASQPTGQTCTASNAIGAGVVASVSNVVVTCSTNSYQVAGAVTGLAAGQQVTLYNNSGNPTTITADGAFFFSTPIAFNGSYSVTVASQPVGQTCTVSNGSGSGVVANINNVIVTCSTNTYQIAGTVTGLDVGKQVTLYNAGGNPTTVTANGAFRFSTPVAFNGTYSVTVGTHPINQVCYVSNGYGSPVVANVSNVTISCSGIIAGAMSIVSGLAWPQGLAVDSGGFIYLAESSNNRILKISRQGQVSTFAAVQNPSMLTFGRDGNLYASLFNARTVVRIASTGAVSTFSTGYFDTEGLAFDRIGSLGNLYVVNNFDTTLSKVGPTGGTATPFATLPTQYNIGLAVGPDDNIYVAGNAGTTGSVTKITPSGVKSVFATFPEKPNGIAFDRNGYLYVAACENIRVISPTGVQSILQVNTPISCAWGIAFDSTGDIYITDAGAGKGILYRLVMN
jgi:sugar lactone lactonase YvrE